MYTKELKKLRTWQATCYQKLQEFKARQKNTFLAVAGVGSGKTFFAAHVFSEFKKQGVFDAVVIVSPTENIKRNWSVTFQEEFNLKIDHGYTFQHGWPRDCQGISITFQSLHADNVETLRRYINPRVLLLVDEVHHAGNNKAWGDAIQEIGELAGFILLLSGTPTRSDNSPIPFVTYKSIDPQNRKYELQHDFCYGYAESIQDEVCCPTIFQRNRSEVKTTQGYKKLDNCREITPEDKQMYNNIISVKKEGSCYVYSTFKKANQKLNEINDTRNANHAGLIICNGKSDAERLYKRIYNTYGADFVELVTSDDQQANEKIEQFKTSAVPWIIAINMISEGVDISRIRCIVYASNAVTKTHFIQVMGRGVRNPKHKINNNDVCYMYIADYKPLIDLACTIEEEIKHVRQELEKKFKKDYPPRDTGTLSFHDIVLSATSEDSGSVFSNTIFDLDEDMDATIMAKKYNVTKDIVLHILKYLREKTGQPFTPEEKPVKLKTITEEKETYKKLIQKVISKIYYDHKIDFSHVHTKLNKELKCSGSNVLTLKELKQKLNLAKQLYKKLNLQKKNG